MSEIVYVSPQLYLLSKKWWKSDLQKPGYIPILRADVPKFQQSLQQLAKSTETPKPLGGKEQNTESNTSTANLSAGSTATKEESSKSENTYHSLKQFFPIGLQQQLHTISLQGIPNKLSDESLKSFLTHCIGAVLRWQSIDETADIESWTNVRFTDLQRQDVYFRFGQIDDTVYAKICKSMETLFPHSAEEGGRYVIEFHIDSNTRQLVQDTNTKIEDEGEEETRDEILKTLTTFESTEGSNEKTEEGQFDQSSDYQVDLNTLSDLPSEFLPQLCKDIIDFRTRVVSIERERRVRDSYEESKRRKHQLMKVFDQIRKSQKQTVGPDEIGSDESDDEQTEETGRDEDDLLIERQREDQMRQESNQRYEEAIRQLKDDIEPRLIALQKEISRQRNYEQSLLDERPLHLKELLHQASDPYYDHHRSFKQIEEQRDATDRDEKGSNEPKDTSSPVPETASQVEDQDEHAEKSVSAASEQVKIKFAFKKAIDKSILETTQEEESVPALQQEQATQTLAGTNSLPETLPFGDEELESRLDKLKESRVVDELVKEYLGVYEDELVQYILDNIREHRSKQVLLDELRETFDDEAVTIVDAIWSSNQWT